MILKKPRLFHLTNSCILLSGFIFLFQIYSQFTNYGKNKEIYILFYNQTTTTLHLHTLPVYFVLSKDFSSFPFSVSFFNFNVVFNIATIIAREKKNQSKCSKTFVLHLLLLNAQQQQLQKKKHQHPSQF